MKNIRHTNNIIATPISRAENKRLLSSPGTVDCRRCHVCILGFCGRSRCSPDAYHRTHISAHGSQAQHCLLGPLSPQLVVNAIRKNFPELEGRLPKGGYAKQVFPKDRSCIIHYWSPYGSFEPSDPGQSRGLFRHEGCHPDIKSLYKIDAAMAISQAELGNTIISCRGALNEKRASDMTDKQREVFEETVRLIDSAHGTVSSPRLSQLDTEFASQVDPEALTDHTNSYSGPNQIEEILHKSQRYLKLKEELSGLRAPGRRQGLIMRLKKIAVLEKAAGRIETEAERTAEAEARVLIRCVKRMKTDLFNALENFTAARKYMRSAQVRFKAIRDTVRQIEGGIQEPPPLYYASRRPIDFDYEYHLPEKRAMDTQWWISKGFSWWANLAYSHLVQTSTNLEEAIHKYQSRQAVARVKLLI
ncbi:hypothetical protein DID88_010418 [Monilinia fructigena]|uniref:Uncharacterized protein n=1 Tax=Monilinia fructigena TaxID=38457 RepID=A0A395ILC8_9HELO|nr:hypothetical protein DID88_010418 [Monilinia fructigena]